MNGSRHVGAYASQAKPPSWSQPGMARLAEMQPTTKQEENEISNCEKINNIDLAIVQCYC